MDVEIGTGLCSTSMVSPSTAICSLAPRGRLAAGGHEQRQPQHGHADGDERPAPALDPAGQAGDAPDGHRPDQLADGQAQAVDREDAAPGLDRVGVGQQRVVHRQDVRGGQARAHAGHEQPERVPDGRGGDRQQPVGQGAGAGDRGAPPAVGQGGDGDAPHDEQHAERPADGAEHGARHPERVLDVGRQHGHGQVVDTLDHGHRGQRHQQAHPALAEGVAQADVVAADDHEVLVGVGAFGTAVGGVAPRLLVEDERRQSRGVGRTPVSGADAGARAGGRRGRRCVGTRGRRPAVTHRRRSSRPRRPSTDNPRGRSARGAPGRASCGCRARSCPGPRRWW